MITHRFTYYLSFLFAVLAIFRTVAQDKDAITFEVEVSKSTLGINERLRVDFVMNKDGDNFTPPDFEGFRVLMGPSQSISSSWINGVRSYSKTYSYTLGPTSRGTFKIKQASITIDGNIYKSLAKTVEVTAAVDKPSDQMSVDNIANENLHLVAEISKTNPYLNEAISVVYKLYVSPTINVRDFRPLDNPKYNNFWSQDMPFTKYNVQNGTYKGKSYRYVVLKRVVLYPQKTGELSIEPLSLDVSLEVPTNRRDFFGGRVYSQANKTVSAGKRVISVKPLPTQGKPADFTGAVGDFKFSVNTSKTSLNASESLQAIVEVRGKGNLKLFQLPKPSVPSSLEVYDPEFSEDVKTTITGMQGKVSENYTIVPAYRGKYPIPGISFSYFDPNSESYNTITSEEITINVLEGPLGNSSAPSEVAGLTKKTITSTGDQFRFIKLEPNLTSVSTNYFFGSTRFYVWMFSPLLLIPLAMFFVKKRETIASDIAGNKIKKANRLAKKYLSESKKALGNKESFYIALEKALHNYLKAKLKLETTDFSKDKIMALLSKRNIEDTTINSFVDLLKNCEMARYSPFSDVQMQQDYEKASETISLMDKKL